MEDQARDKARAVVRWIGVLIPVLFVALVGLALADAWSRRPVSLKPRHRAEAVCYALAGPPTFSPPMRVESSAAMVQTNLPSDTPPAVALQQTMKFSDDMVLRASTRKVGDYPVATMWLRIPGADASRHWLIVCWMEGTELAVCNFRFAGDGPALSDAQSLWGHRLLARVLRAELFSADALPAVTLRAARNHDATLVFGPRS